jgi:hypothetical protein
METRLFMETRLPLAGTERPLRYRIRPDGMKFVTSMKRFRRMFTPR